MIKLRQLGNASYDIIHCSDVVAQVNTFSQSFTVNENEWNLLTPEQKEEVRKLAINVLRGKHENHQKDD